jgi:hypothetical protein
VITLELAMMLHDAGLAWTPVSGDRFTIPVPGLDDKVFVVSEMTIETERLPTGDLVRFNGTTEWALDSIPQDEVVWLPHEEQLRSLLGSRFARLEAVPDGFAVVLEDRGRTERHLDIDAERAYARALLSVLRG